MKLSAKKYAQVLLSLVEEGKVRPEIIESFMTFLRKNRQERLLPRILIAAEQLHKEATGTKDVYMTVPEEVDAKHFETLLKESLDAKHVILHQQVDKNMVGGARMQIDDRIYDFSLRRQLQLLQEHLIHNR